ncbi:MAG: hypothetical protein IH831_09845 [Planctomycetes bacterium]|nr:hypothetical protein [Planctomycetota bacterium]
MHGQVFSYQFSPSLDIVDVEATVTLAILATESLHGESRVKLEAPHTFDAKNRTCTIEASSEVGRDLNRLFLGFVSREFGRDSFQVERVAPAA